VATEFTPGAITALMEKVSARVLVKGGQVLEPIALAIERQAKLNASNGEHTYHTRTPASPGSGPARVSGTLVRSITHSTPRPAVAGWSCKVGLANGTYPPYNRRTPSSKYGYYLETGLRNGSTYPFLVPALKKVNAEEVKVVFEALFSAGW
jgi:hypothetical protein